MTYDGGLAAAGDWRGQLLFYPAAELASLRTRLLHQSDGAWSGTGGAMPLPAAAGNCLDLELNVSWPGGAVPVDFGSVGVSILGGTEVLISSDAQA